MNISKDLNLNAARGEEYTISPPENSSEFEHYNFFNFYQMVPNFAKLSKIYLETI